MAAEKTAFMTYVYMFP